VSISLSNLGSSALAPGVWRAALPFPSPLAYSFGYFVNTDAGVVAIDLGWDSDESWALWRQGLDRAGAGLDELVGVVITHAHPDHYGLARRVRSVTDAWIAMHPGELAQIAPGAPDKERRLADMREWLRLCGAPEAELGRLRDEDREIRDHLPTIQPDVLLHDGDAVPGTAGRLRAIHTPGHTPGHLCIADHDTNLLFTGDHILPRITPNVSRRPTSGDDPLEDYTASITRLEPMDGALVLPGHEWSFDRLGERLATLQVHHVARLEEIREAVERVGSGTVWQIASSVTWSREFDSLNGRATRSALGETLAHLVRLTNMSELEVQHGIPRRWTVGNRASSAASEERLGLTARPDEPLSGSVRG
jgi:glyoxylase-like metal-dependent hydrolase (beta-lactamase superfamily II)